MKNEKLNPEEVKKVIDLLLHGRRPTLLHANRETGGSTVLILNYATSNDSFGASLFSIGLASEELAGLEAGNQLSKFKECLQVGNVSKAWFSAKDGKRYFIKPKEKEVVIHHHAYDKDVTVNFAEDEELGENIKKMFEKLLSQAKEEAYVTIG